MKQIGVWNFNNKVKINTKLEAKTKNQKPKTLTKCTQKLKVQK